MTEREKQAKRELVAAILEDLSREVAVDVAMDIAVIVWDAGWRPRTKRVAA